MSTSRAQTLVDKPRVPEQLPLQHFEKITINFSVDLRLGTGPFGSVYKGILEDGRAVAVKKLRVGGPVPEAKLFFNEVQNIEVPEHDNLVKLESFCREFFENKPVLIDGEYITGPVTETVLCYEYFPNRSLDKHIFGGSNTIGWNTRFNIIKGICRGIHCLHSMPTPILHLGLKPQNILLDGNMVPKIVDSVFSRIFDQKESRKQTKSRVGTEGYMAPEYVDGSEISARSDIYSLGIIILEIVTGQKNQSKNHAHKYRKNVEKNWRSDDNILSEYDDLDKVGISEVKACIRIGLWCSMPNQPDRPRIQEIIDDLCLR